MLMADN